MHDAKHPPFSAELMMIMEKKGPAAWFIVENLVRACLDMPPLPEPEKTAQPQPQPRPRLRLVSPNMGREAADLRASRCPNLRLVKSP